jgi:hypothetical protein
MSELTAVFGTPPLEMCKPVTLADMLLNQNSMILGLDQA